MKQGSFKGTAGWLAMVAAGLFACAVPKAAQADWTSVWTDDFNGFDTGKWAKGFAWGNTFGSTPNTYYDPANVWVSNGTLKLSTSGSGKTVDGKYYKWTGAKVNTFNRAFFNPNKAGIYGVRVRIRAKIPAGQGINPAAWMLKNDSSFPWPPEIDIFEAPGNRGGNMFWSVYYPGGGGANKQTGSYTGTVGDGQFHWYDWNGGAKATSFAWTA